MKRLTPTHLLRTAFAAILWEKVALSACCLILVLPAPGLLSQNNPGFCDELIQRAERALKARDYISASAFVESALPICPARNDTLRTLTKRINEAINAEKKTAEEGADASHNIARALDLDRSNPALALRLYEYNYYAHVGNIGATLPLIDAVASLPQISSYTLEGHLDWVSSVAWSPDGRFLAGASADSTVKIWDWVKKQAIDSLCLTSSVWGVAWSPNNDQIAAAGKDGNVILWDRKQKRQLNLPGHKGIVYSVAWSPNGKLIASAAADSTIIIWKPETQEIVHTFKGHTDEVNSISWSPDGKLLVSASSDRTIKVWDLSEKRELYTFPRQRSKVSSAVWSPDSAYIASASFDGAVKIWDWNEKQELHSLSGHFERVSSVTWSLDNKQLASASVDGSVKVWDWAEKKVLYDLKAETHTRSDQPARFYSVAWSPKGKQLAGACNSIIKVWDWAAQQAQFTYTGHTGAVNAVAWSPDGRLLAGASADSTVRVWEWGKQDARFVLKGHSASVNTVAWSVDGHLASASDDRKVIIWKLSEKLRADTLTTSSSVRAVAWSPSGRHLAVALEDGYIEIWDVATRELQHEIAGHLDWANALAWSPDGKLLATASSEGAVKIWDWAKGELLHTLSGRWAEIRSVAWSPSGRWIASASSDRTLRIWDWAAQRVLATIEEPFDGFWSVAWSPSGGQVACTSYDNTVKVWDVAAKQTLFSLAGHSGRINAVAWSPDGKYVAGASRDNTIKVWAARPYLADKIPVYSPVSLLRNGARLQQTDLDALEAAEDIALAAGQFKEAGRDERALVFFKEAFARKDSLNWLFDICTLSDSLGEPFEHSRFDAYTDVDAQHKIALYYELRGEKLRAFSFFEKANEQQQQLERLFRVLSLSKELDKPFEHSRFDSFEEAGDNIDIARFYEQRGEKSRALSFYEKAYGQSQKFEWNNLDLLFVIYELAEEVGQDFNHERFDAFESGGELYDIALFYEQKRDTSRTLSFYQKTWVKRPSTDIAEKISRLSDQLGLHFNPEDLPHEDAAACAALAGYFEGEEDWGKARAYTQKAYDKSPNDMQKAKLIEMTMLLGEFSALTRETDLKVLTTVARGLNQKGKWAQAEKACQQLFDLDATNPSHRQLLFYVQFRQGKDNFDKFFSDESINNIRIHYDWFNQLANPSSMGGDTLALISWYKKATILGEQLLKHTPGDTILARRLSQNYNGIGWQGLFQGLYVEAEEALRQGIKVDPANQYLHTNLPIALLLQGRYDESFKLFDEYKDKKYAPERNLPTYRDIFLLDFDRLEEAVAIPPERREDVERMRRYLWEGVRE